MVPGGGWLARGKGAWDVSRPSWREGVVGWYVSNPNGHPYWWPSWGAGAPPQMRQGTNTVSRPTSLFQLYDWCLKYIY